MPELPEVETVRRAAEATLVGRRVVALAVRNPQLRRPVDIEALKANCVGREIRGFRRRGKCLLADFGDGCVVLLHLGMSGRFHLLAPETPIGPHEHVVWMLDDGREWRFHDPRRFGLVVPIRLPPHGNGPPELASLGPEPLDPAWSGATLHCELRKTRRTVKLALLDQSVVAGLGNIYVCEALFEAGISPKRAAYRIGGARCDRLVEAVRNVLNDALEHGGTSLRDFASLDGSEGRFAVRLRVYNRESAPCPRCGERARIRRIVQQNRSTYYCPNCQT